jgi:hypothetical protein
MIKLYDFLKYTKRKQAELFSPTNGRDEQRHRVELERSRSIASTYIFPRLSTSRLPALALRFLRAAASLRSSPPSTRRHHRARRQDGTPTRSFARAASPFDPDLLCGSTDPILFLASDLLFLCGGYWNRCCRTTSTCSTRRRSSRSSSTRRSASSSPPTRSSWYALAFRMSELSEIVYSLVVRWETASNCVLYFLFLPYAQDVKCQGCFNM